MGLFDELYKENYKYINSLEAIDLLARDEGYNFSDVAKFLLIHKFPQTIKTYKKSYLGQIELCDYHCDDFHISNDWKITADIIDKALECFEYTGNDYTEMYQKEDYENYFWLKEDFFNFEGFKAANFKIDNEYHERYLNYRQIDRLNQTHPTIEQQSSIKPYQKRIDSLENENDQLRLEIQKIKNVENKKYDYRYYLFKKPLLNLLEASCIMTGHDPSYVHKCRNDTNFDHNFSDYLSAFGYLDSATEIGLLAYDNTNGVITSDFKDFLESENIIIEGFNENLTKISSFHDDQAYIALKSENELLEKENERLKKRVNKDKNLTDLIFDESQIDIYAPDLVHAIKLWEHLYINNPKNDTHSNRAKQWLAHNTGYDKSGTSANKIREITTPFVNWSTHRDKKINPT